ncbi:MAG TPA: hypothetical protein VG742_19690 [Dongiaceae bacterium]|nr:hypothetical protein [Dongiaceae bacterium]
MIQAVRIGLSLLLVLTPLVHRLGAVSPAQAREGKQKSESTSARQRPPPGLTPVHYGIDDLPQPVREMRELILSAAQSGEIEELRTAVEVNELKPEIAGTPVADPIAYWKRISGDGEGREILAALAEVLDSGYVILPIGPDLENNKVYVWPYFAEVPLDRLSPGQQVELLRLITPAALREMQRTGRYSSWRLAIGADGTWHSFRKAE